MNTLEKIGNLRDRQPDGQMSIKGLAYEDIVAILLNNGYEVVTYSDAYEEQLSQNISERWFYIAYWKSDVNKLLTKNFSTIVED